MGVKRKVLVEITDDFSGKVGSPDDGFVEGFQFSIDGEYYKIDISPETRTKIEKAMQPFVAKATGIDPPKAPGKSGFKLTGEQREWHGRALNFGRTDPRVPEDIRPAKGGWMASKALKGFYLDTVKDDPYPED